MNAAIIFLSDRISCNTICVGFLQTETVGCHPFLTWKLVCPAKRDMRDVFIRNVGKLFSELKLVTDNLLSLYSSFKYLDLQNYKNFTSILQDCPRTSMLLLFRTRVSWIYVVGEFTKYKFIRTIFSCLIVYHDSTNTTPQNAYSEPQLQEFMHS